MIQQIYLMNLMTVRLNLIRWITSQKYYRQRKGLEVAEYEFEVIIVNDRGRRN